MPQLEAPSCRSGKEKEKREEADPPAYESHAFCLESKAQVPDPQVFAVISRFLPLLCLSDYS